MGLGVTVGILADLLEHDEGGASWVTNDFIEINNLLHANGLEKHSEPENCEIWSAEGYGYAGLHALREVAGLAWSGKQIPRDVLLTGQDKSCGDNLYEAALPQIQGKKRGEPSLPFLHLIAHSDAEGYYVPVDFPVPLMPSTNLDDSSLSWPLGSVQQLSGELAALKELLEIPDDLVSQSEILTDLIGSNEPRMDGALWEAQPIATYTALILIEACEASLKTGASISFG